MNKVEYKQPKVEQIKLKSMNLLQNASIEVGDLYGDGEEYTEA